MKRDLKTLNEEMNRMKSLFGESRLYGNLSDYQGENIITEQFKFFDNLSDIFKLSIKNIDSVKLGKFLNFEVRNFGDIASHIDDFKSIWKIVAPEHNWDSLGKYMKKLEGLESSGKWNELTLDEKNTLLGVIPENGGMRDITLNIMAGKKGKNEIKTSGGEIIPIKSEERIVTTHPKTGEVLIGTKGKDEVVTYKNEKGEKVEIEDEKVEEPFYKSDIEDVDFEEIPTGTKLEDLDGKTVRATEENLDKVIDASQKIVKEETQKGKKVKFTLEGEGDEGILAAKEMFDRLTDGKNQVDELAKEAAKQAVREAEVNTPNLSVDDRNIIYKYYQKLFGEWPTRYVLNPTTLMPKVEGPFKKFSLGAESGFGDDMTKLGIVAGFKPNIARVPAIFWRVIVITPLATEIIIASFDKERDVWGEDSNFITNYVNDMTWIIGKIINKDWSPEVKQTLDLLASAIENLSGGKIIPKVIMSKTLEKVNLDLEKLVLNPDGKTVNEKACEEILDKSNGDIIKGLIMKHANIEIGLELDRAAKKGYEKAAQNTINQKLDSYKNLMADVFSIDTDFITAIERNRALCVEYNKNKETEVEQEKRREEISSEDYVVKFVPGDTTGTVGMK